VNSVRTLFACLWAIDALMVLMMWSDKLHIREIHCREEDEDDSKLSKLWSCCCGKCCTNVALLFMWLLIIILIIGCLLVPILAVLVFFSGYLCEGVAKAKNANAVVSALEGTEQVEAEQVEAAAAASLEQVKTFAESSFAAFFPSGPPANLAEAQAMLGNATDPTLLSNLTATLSNTTTVSCDGGKHDSQTTAFTLFLCTPLLLLAQIMILTSASTVFYSKQWLGYERAEQLSLALATKKSSGESASGDSKATAQTV